MDVNEILRGIAAAGFGAGATLGYLRAMGREKKTDAAWTSNELPPPIREAFAGINDAISQGFARVGSQIATLRDVNLASVERRVSGLEQSSADQARDIEQIGARISDLELRRRAGRGD